MSSLRTIPRSEWQSFFDRLSDALLGKWAEIEVATMDLGDTIIAKWIPMLGITYEPKDDLLDVALDRTNHVIRRPKEIVVEEHRGELVSIAVLDSDGARQTVHLKHPLAIPGTAAVLSRGQPRHTTP